MNREYVLDASALLAVLRGEPGQERVRTILDRAVIHSVNLAEAVAKLADAGASEDDILSAIEALGLTIDPDLPYKMAVRSGMLAVSAKAYGLSLGDRVCVTFARMMGARAVTADRRWKEVPGLSGSVVLIR